MLDVNNFDQLRIGLATADADPHMVQRRGQEAGDHQLPHAQAGEGRALLREDLRAHEGLGVAAAGGSRAASGFKGIDLPERCSASRN